MAFKGTDPLYVATLEDRGSEARDGIQLIRQYALRAFLPQEGQIALF